MPLAHQIRAQAAPVFIVSAPKSHQLRPGIALSPAQVAQLTSDIVWLVEQSVTLPNGQVVKALVPQVYVFVRPGDLSGSGGLLAGKQVNINLGGDLLNTGTISGGMAGRSVVRLNANNVNNLGGRINADAVAIDAKVDLNNIGGTISANSQLQVNAGRDIHVATTSRSASSTAGANSFSRTSIDRVAGLYVSGDGSTGTGVLIASAGNNVNIMGGVISNSGKDGATSITAAKDINLASVTTASADNLVFNPQNTVSSANTRQVGSTIEGAGSVRLQAGNDITTSASSAQASGALTLVADNNITLTTAQNTDSFAATGHSTSKSFLSKKSTTTRDTLASTTAAGSTLGGNTVVLSAGNNLVVKGSEVISDNATTLLATNNITLEAAQNTSSSTSLRSESKSGLMSGGGASVFIGKKQSATDQKDQTTTTAASAVGSIGGNVNIMAGQSFRQVGSDILTPAGDINILAKDVEIIEARELSASQTATKTKQAGLTVSLSNPVLSAVQGVASIAQAAKNTSSGRMQSLAAAAAGLTGYNTYNSLTDKAGKFDPAKAADINVSVSLGSSKSQSNSASNSNTARGSTVAAGNNVNINATGAGADSNLLIQGSNIKAANNVSLAADNQVNLLAAKNESSQASTNSSSSGSVGVSVGGQTGVTLAGSKGKGKSNGADTSYTNSQISAGNTAAITSGGDTNIKGAVVAANTIKADVGTSGQGSLNMESLQDTSTYTGSQKSAGGSITIGPSGPTGGSVSASKSNINSDFRSVGEQSGLKAGDGGFQVNVANNTNLTGAVIASTQKAVEGNANTFATGGQLNTTDVQNTASFKGEGYSVSASVSTGKDKKTGKEVTTPGGSFGVGSTGGDASSTSLAGISGIAGNTAVRTGDAENGLQRIFDADKVQKEVNAQVVITQAFTKESSKAAETYFKNQREQLQERHKQATTDEEKQQAQQALKDLVLQERAINILIGAVTGTAASAITKEGLSAAADEMRQLMTADSKKFAGVTDGATELTNISGTSDGVRGDGNKIGGTRVDLDLLCGAGNERCARNDDGSLKVNQQGQVEFIAGSLADFIKTPEGQKMSGATGGIQGAQGTLFGIPYSPGSWQDKLIEAFSGTHDMIGGKLSGLYDAQGNIKRGMTADERATYDKLITTSALVPTIPFAAAELVPFPVWNAISIFLKAAR